MIASVLTFSCHTKIGTISTQYNYSFLSLLTNLPLYLYNDIFKILCVPASRRSKEFNFFDSNLLKGPYIYDIQWMGGRRSGKKWLKFSIEGGRGIHRNWMSRAISSISVIRIQTVFQTGVCFCYKCSRLVSGSAISVPDRCLVLL